MFPAALHKSIQKIDTVRRIIETNDGIRSLLAASETKYQTLQEIVNRPSTVEWRIYDHCSAITRLYAIYEAFVEDLLTDLVGLLPTLFSYTELGNSFHKEHRAGIANILQKLETHRYSGVSEEVVIKDYHNAISGHEPYVIHAESLLSYEQNLKMNIIESLFSRIGISNLGAWINNYRLMQDFIVNIRGEQNTVDAELTSFIQYRNEAAHGNTEDVLGKEALLEYCVFIESLCQAIYERVNHWIINRKLAQGTASDIGFVSEKLSNRIIIAKLSNTTASVSDSFFFIGKSYCYRASIESIQVDGVPQQSVEITNEQEIGFRTDITVKKNARLICVNTP